MHKQTRKPESKKIHITLAELDAIAAVRAILKFVCEATTSDGFKLTGVTFNCTKQPKVSSFEADASGCFNWRQVRVKLGFKMSRNIATHWVLFDTVTVEFRTDGVPRQHLRIQPMGHYSMRPHLDEDDRTLSAIRKALGTVY